MSKARNWISTNPAQIAVWTDGVRDDSAAECLLTQSSNGSFQVEIEAKSGKSITWLAIHWTAPIPSTSRILGDHWERGYGDLEWRGIVSERVLSWYALVNDSSSGETFGVGVQTGAASFASWRVDQSGISLVLDVRSGGLGVKLNDRHLLAATIHELASECNESAFAFARRFCTKLCPNPRLPVQPVYGGNDWYFRYGANSEQSVLRDAALVRELSPSTSNAPTFVIDAGWSPGICDGGPYDRGTEKFPDMAGIASKIRDLGVRPGIWIRPLLTNDPALAKYALPTSHPNESRVGHYLDPSIPEVLELVRTDISRLRDWGFELIKHDFTTYDITGRWGFEMGAEITPPGWSIADRSKTTAEIVSTLYQTIRDSAHSANIIGCNTIGHLGAGLFEIQRTGDDTSGKHWERTRKMGINTLAFRMTQHETFYAADADCVGLTSEIPWELNKQWLDVLARSGTPLFVSADPDYIGAQQKEALREAFDIASKINLPGEPRDWLDTTCPRSWRFGDQDVKYVWDSFPDSVFSCPG